MYLYEHGIARHIKSRALFSFRQDKRLGDGMNLCAYDASLFREYLDNGFPLFFLEAVKAARFSPAA